MTRSELREHTFKMIFRIEFYEEKECEEQFLKYVSYISTILTLSDDEIEYLMSRTTGILAKKSIIDEKINQVAKGWETTRMSKVDLSIIRLALYEILYDSDIPTKVAINEAVEIAKSFGGDDSPAFINAILAKLV